LRFFLLFINYLLLVVIHNESYLQNLAIFRKFTSIPISILLCNWITLLRIIFFALAILWWLMIDALLFLLILWWWLSLRLRRSAFQLIDNLCVEWIGYSLSRTFSWRAVALVIIIHFKYKWYISIEFVNTN
jgi:hypothetical protein